MGDFFKFPHTPHALWLGKQPPRTDKVLSTSSLDSMLSNRVVLEEKVDGANIGLSVGGDGDILVQNRGEYIRRPFSGQFSRLSQWLAKTEGDLFDKLGSQYILFGEWLAATHSVEYTKLPDYFIAFDVFDKFTGRFFSTARRDQFASGCGVISSRRINAGFFSRQDLVDIVLNTDSAFSSAKCEGIYIRHEDENWLLARAKVVHPDFVQSIGTHWRASAIRWNTVSRFS